MAKVDIGNVARAIEKELSAFEDGVTMASKQAVEEVAEETRKEIQDNSPVDKGKYKRGWKVKTVYESSTEKRDTVYNSTAPGLTHLLEFGHAKVRGGRVSAQPHIAPAAGSVEQKLQNQIAKNLGKG